jgi:hypothetical protein
LKDPLAFRRSQQESNPIANVGHSMTTDQLCFKNRKTTYDETFDEWRSDFTTVLLVSMFCGMFISALSNQEVL